MAFRASSALPAEGLLQAKRAALQLKLNLQAYIAQLAAEPVGFPTIRDIYATLVRADNQFAAVETIPGIAEYAAAQENDVDYDIAAEFVAMRSAITAAGTWLANNLPATANVAPPSQWTQETVTSNTFTPAATAGFRTALQGVVDSID